MESMRCSPYKAYTDTSWLQAVSPEQMEKGFLDLLEVCSCFSSPDPEACVLYSSRDEMLNEMI